jgi:hypothetical protein
LTRRKGHYSKEGPNPYKSFVSLYYRRVLHMPKPFEHRPGYLRGELPVIKHRMLVCQIGTFDDFAIESSTDLKNISTFSATARASNHSYMLPLRRCSNKHQARHIVRSRGIAQKLRHVHPPDRDQGSRLRVEPGACTGVCSCEVRLQELQPAGHRLRQRDLS